MDGGQVHQVPVIDAIVTPYIKVVKFLALLVGCFLVAGLLVHDAHGSGPSLVDWVFEQFLDFALTAASYYYIMEKGQIVAEGPTAQMSQTTVQQYLAV